MDREKRERQIFSVSQKLLKTFYNIRNKLDEQYMTVSDVTERLGISRRQLFYWDLKGMKLSKKETLHRSWRKFSIMDLFGFAVLNELRKFGMKLNQCQDVLNWLRKDMYDSPFFIYHLAEGDPIFLFVDINNKVAIRFGSVVWMDQVVKPNLVVPLSPLLRVILLRTKKDDFNVTFREYYARGGHIETTKLIFHIAGEAIKFEFNKKERKCVSELERHAERQRDINSVVS